MRKLLCRVVFALCAVQAGPDAWAADPRWIRMPSADFEIFSSAGEGDTRRTLQNFERVRNFFEQAMGGKVDKSDPVRIIVFGSKKEYLPYRPNEVAIAFYTQISGRDYIVMGDTSDEVFPIAVHEYVHLVAQHAGLELPPWLNEGIAEVYSTIKPAGDKVLLGTPVLGRVQALQREKWVPLETILAADHNSPYYNEKNKAGSLYNEGWLLTHMLVLNNDYSAKFPQIVDAIQKESKRSPEEKGLPEKENAAGPSISQRVLERTLGKPLAQIDKDLQNYGRNGTFSMRQFNLKLQTAEKVAAEPAALFDVRLALADLTMRPGKEAETRTQLELLAKDDPRRPEPHVALGYLAMHERNMDDARQAFQKAIELGSANPQMLWTYGRLAIQANPELAMKALTTVLANQPNRFEVRLALAQTQMNARLAKDAIETMKPVTSVTPKDAREFFKLLAYAHMEDHNNALARANAERWLEYAKDPAEHDQASKMIEFINNQERAVKEQAARPARVAAPRQAESALDPATDDAAPKTLARNAPPSLSQEDTPKLPQRPFAVGSMAELDCKNAPPTLVLLQTGVGRVGFLMDEPRSITLSGLKDVIIDMNCGPQKPAAVWVEYEPPSPTQKGVKGLVRAIHFEPLPEGLAPPAAPVPDKTKLKTR